MALLRFDRQGGDRARLEPPDRDRLAGFLAIAVGAVVEAMERGLDLGDQLALAVAGPELDRPVGLGRRAVGEIRVVLVFVLQVLERVPRFLQDVFLPGEQLRGNTPAGARS